ncbi:MAG TPA: TonB-dependent receptor [Rhizomicrobium sp.]|nr:TonB-dependent receptor [Rhizomicrobium sp.]
MRVNLKFILSCGAAVAALMTATGASWADAPQGGIEEVVVSAERRDMSVQNVPSTVQAFTGQTLSDLNINTFDDLLKFTPNVTFGNNGPGQGEITMRGLSNGFRGNQSSGTIAGFPNVAIYLDDQSMSFPARNLDVYMVDMDRIEVLEGPQGTLFGGGAEAGAVRYITNKPNLSQFEGKAEASYGTTTDGAANSSANLMINVPIINDKLAVRVVVYDERQGGYIDNVPSTFTRSNLDGGNHYFGITPTGGLCPNGLPAGAAGYCALPNSAAPQANNYQTAQKDFNPVTYQGFRAQLAYQFDDDWSALISESFMDEDAQGMFVQYPVGSEFQTLKPLQVTAYAPSYNKDRTENTSWTINGKLFDGIKLVYTGGYTLRHINEQMDYTNYSRTTVGMYYQCTGGTTGWGTAAPQCFSPIAFWHDQIKGTHQSHELRLSTPDDWRFRMIAGAYWEDFKIYDDMNFKYKTIPSCNTTNLAAALGGGPVCVADVRTAPGSTANDPGIRDDNTGFGEDTQRGYKQTAAFVSADYDIIPDTLTVSAGTRWYQYQEFEVGSQYGTGTGCLNVPNGDCVGGLVNIDAAHDRITYTGFKSRANITWHVDPDTMVYYTWSEGFRPGGFNRSVSNVAPDATGAAQYTKPNGYAPDELINNEIGVKTTLFDDRLQLNASAYFMRWNHVQFVFFNPLYLGNTTFATNGPNYDVKGGELQFIGKVTDNLTLQGSGSYNDNTQKTSPCLVDNIPGTAAYGHCITEIIPRGSVTAVPFVNPFGEPGSTPAFSPKFQGNVRARYDWMIDQYAAFLQVGVNYMGSMFNQPASYKSGAGILIPDTTFLRYKQPAYTTVDATFGISFDKWYAQLFGTNLTNSHASTFTSSAQFIKSEVPLRPRVIGLKVGYNF